MVNNCSSKDEVIASQDVPLTALSKTTLRRLSQLLNSKTTFLSEDGYERDWRGLACLAKQKYLCNENTSAWDDPISKVIQLWCTNNPRTATFAYLERFLGIIDRWDVSDNIYENLVEDTKLYQAKQQHSSDLKSDEYVENHNFNGDFGHGSDPNILTTGDVIRAQKGLSPQMYDAFVLYADADLNYAIEMLTKLEDNPEYGFKFCMKDRDLLAGVQFEHVALTQLIEERCKHLIVILTKVFLKSPENKFLVNYTHYLQMQHKTRKIIPLLYEDNVNIPRTLSIYTVLPYNSSCESLFNFWFKLANSIRNVNVITPTTTLDRNTAYGAFITSSGTSNKNSKQLNKSPIPQGIPSIIITPAEDENPKIKKESKLKRLTMRAHDRSTGQLHTSYRQSNGTSISHLSTIFSYGNIKNKIKLSIKAFKKVFSRSYFKL